MSFDNSASYYQEVAPRIEERADGTHVYVDAPRSAKVRDAAPMVSSIREADPQDPKSGAQPAGGAFVCDFRRDSRSGRWTGQAGGRRFRLQQSHDGAVFRVSEDRSPPWSVRVGDRALADPSRPLSAEQETAGLARWSQRLSDFWRRKDGPEAA